MEVGVADHGAACERRYLAEGVVLAFTIPLFSYDAGENPRLGALDQATTPRCRYLLEYAI
jgi:hypothetical protein